MRSVRRYRARLARGLRTLRGQYQNALRNRGKGGAVYREWLRDNHYLIEREGRAALRELRRSGAKPEALFPVLSICRELCARGLPESEALAGALLCTRCKSAGVALVPLALRLALVESAVNSMRTNDSAAQVKRLSDAITCLRAMPDIDFEQVSPLERRLRRDPAGIYPRMEESSRAVYRHLLAQRAKKNRHSEEEEAQALLDRAAGAWTGADKHVGTALLKQAYHPKRGAALLVCESLLPVLLAGGAALALRSWFAFPLLCLPLTALCRVLLEAAFLRGIQPVPLPRVELNGVVPGEGRTLVTVSTLLPGGNLGRRMEELYSSNGGPNVSICVLADLKGASCAELPGDEADLQAARIETERLCAKYNGGFTVAQSVRARDS